MITVKGKIQYRAIASGTWVLVSDTGETYELYKPSENLRQEGLKVEIKGNIRSDVMTIAMVGQILEVKEFSICR
ncbi:hypothetical protein [Cyanobacterium aponinum]|uniref:Nucleic acid binding OB-fold tRNA/helicase-type n=1 Tax=Cyanobacterium aponinum 0216 TaxID=2676140 RepID=A0A844GUK2_9CHRO|nr:hypothetical protein [Cyanobacterium aponinum]MTF38508.1 hypothetical protein [Cyanobacterium aponinum 0216]PHV63450.1 hypothetical protein CSQ80_04840 [Cyanobacterium aponinum IPPAS B-1201]